MSMKERVKKGLALLFIFCSIPYLLFRLMGGSEAQNESGDSVSGDLESAIVGMVSDEISMDYEPEAVKAQVVLARTECYRLKEKNGSWPEGKSEEELRDLWGENNYYSNYKKLIQYISETGEMVLRYNGDYIEATYHAVSAGNTRNAEEAGLDSSYDYLQSVESRDDVAAEDYLKVTYITKSEFLEKLQLAGITTNADADNLMDQISIDTRDSASYVTQITIGGTQLGGETFREALGLNSACFYIEEKDGMVRIITKGIGHGLGLSQYGANEMAKDGKDYKEILTYYFYNVELLEE